MTRQDRAPHERAVKSEFERILRIEYAQGKLDLGTMKRLLKAHKEDT